MRIVIVGINHQVQRVKIGSWGSDGKPQQFEREQKEAYRELVRSEIRQVAAEFLAEETRHGEESTTRQVCEQENCRYENVEMLPEEREARGIPPGYNEDFPDMPEVDKVRFNREREEYMAAKTIAEANGAESVVLICGSFHKEALAELFCKDGHSVAVKHLQQQPWYVEDWQHHIMYNL